MGYSEILYSVSAAVATISLNRPDARNGYTTTMSDELGDALRAADADPAVRAVILTGEGKDFCVGADLSGGGVGDIAHGSDGGTWQEPAGRCSRRIYESNKPVIVAVRGAAVGAGSTIILPADYRIAATDSRFGFVFTRRGFFPEGGSAWFLPKLVGMGRATDWMVSGRVFGADEALAAGLVNRLVAPDEVYPAAVEYADELVKNTAPVSVAVTRKMLWRLSSHDSPDAAHRLDSRLIAGISTSPDSIEGVMSFLEHRAPDFPGRVPDDLPDFLPWGPAE